MYASGANTQIIAYEAGKYRVFGETLDMGIGNFLDQLARVFGLGFPGGPKIGMLAQKYRDKCKKKEIEPEYLELPYNVKGMDLAFAGIFTYVKDKLKDKYPIEQIFYSVEETVYAMLNEVCERALAHCGKTEVLLGGGVACAPRLQNMTKQMCTDRKAECFILENQFNVDNAAMIAWLGIVMFDSGIRNNVKDMSINPYTRTDEIKVNWR
jgi:glycoprotease/Kae1 family metallohydrolase